jgi:hypothetical protein
MTVSGFNWEERVARLASQAKAYNDVGQDWKLVEVSAYDLDRLIRERAQALNCVQIDTEAKQRHFETAHGTEFSREEMNMVSTVTFGLRHGRQATRSQTVETGTYVDEDGMIVEYPIPAFDHVEASQHLRDL